MRYTIVIERSPNDYAAYVPDLPGCVADETANEFKALPRFAQKMGRSGKALIQYGK